MRLAIRSASLIEAWFDTLRDDQRAPARRLRDLIIQAEPALSQGVQWGNLLFTLDRTHALAIASYRSHLNLQVFDGATLVERFPMLQGSSRGSRTLKLTPDRPIDEDLVVRVAHARVDDMTEGDSASAGRKSRLPTRL